MATQPKQKLLVPVDGSDRSLNTIKYIAKLDPLQGSSRMGDSTEKKRHRIDGNRPAAFNQIRLSFQVG